MKNKYLVSIFGEDFYYNSKNKALDKAYDADRRYARGFVQVYDLTTDQMIYGCAR